MPSTLAEFLDRLVAIDNKVDEILAQRRVKEFYTIEEIAEILHRSPFTVREWARNSRIHAEKRLSGRGKHKAWVVSHAELLRLEKEGLLIPPGRRAAQ